MANDEIYTYPEVLPDLPEGWSWGFIGNNPEALTTGSKDERVELTTPGLAIPVPTSLDAALDVSSAGSYGAVLYDAETGKCQKEGLSGIVAVVVQKVLHAHESVRGFFRDGKVIDEAALRQSLMTPRKLGAYIFEGVEQGTKAPEVEVSDEMTKAELIEAARKAGVKIRMK